VLAARHEEARRVACSSSAGDQAAQQFLFDPAAQQRASFVDDGRVRELGNECCAGGGKPVAREQPVDRAGFERAQAAKVRLQSAPPYQ